MEKRFGISDAARQVGVEAHVLRYWEDELGLAIPRNGQGHRYYREQDIHILHKIRDWKEQGFQLRAIKLLLPDRRRVEAMTPQELYHLREELNQKVQMEEDRSPKHARMGQVTPLPSAMEVAEPVSSISKEQKLQQFEQMMRDMITSVVEQQTQQSEERIAEAVTEKVSKQMDYLMREKEELQQKQIEILEKILIEMRPAAKEAAATEELPQVTTIRSRKKEREAKRSGRTVGDHSPRIVFDGLFVCTFDNDFAFSANPIRKCCGYVSRSGSFASKDTLFINSSDTCIEYGIYRFFLRNAWTKRNPHFPRLGFCYLIFGMLKFDADSMW